MSIQTKKIELIQWLSNLNDVSIIDKVMKLRESESGDWWLNITKEEQESIEKGLSDAEAGKLIDHSDARKVYEEWS